MPNKKACGRKQCGSGSNSQQFVQVDCYVAHRLGEVHGVYNLKSEPDKEQLLNRVNPILKAGGAYKDGGNWGTVIISPSNSPSKIAKVIAIGPPLSQHPNVADLNEDVSDELPDDTGEMLEKIKDPATRQLFSMFMKREVSMKREVAGLKTKIEAQDDKISDQEHRIINLEEDNQHMIRIIRTPEDSQAYEDAMIQWVCNLGTEVFAAKKRRKKKSINLEPDDKEISDEIMKWAISQGFESEAAIRSGVEEMFNQRRRTIHPRGNACLVEACNNLCNSTLITNKIVKRVPLAYKLVCNAQMLLIGI